jgi:hypothetical protein
VARDLSTNIFATMITIRLSKATPEVALISLEATLTTLHGAYSLSSEGAMTDSGSSFDGNLFGPISWPVSRFRLADGSLLEQQMFLPHDGSAVALSWALRGDTAAAAQLVVRPFFFGCGPRSYRDIGFHFDAEDNGGRLTWLPNVQGPKVFADTNGGYYDEPVRSFHCLCREAAASASEEDLITPGRFEFELGRRPSVLIFSIEGRANAQRDQHIGAFLAGLMQEDSAARASSPVDASIGVRTQHRATA